VYPGKCDGEGEEIRYGKKEKRYEPSIHREKPLQRKKTRRKIMKDQMWAWRPL
jgi:hypothetical protein